MCKCGQSEAWHGIFECDYEPTIWQKCDIQEPTDTPAILRQGLADMLQKAYDAGKSAGALEVIYQNELDKEYDNGN